MPTKFTSITARAENSTPRGEVNSKSRPQTEKPTTVGRLSTARPVRIRKEATRVREVMDMLSLVPVTSQRAQPGVKEFRSKGKEFARSMMPDRIKIDQRMGQGERQRRTGPGIKQGEKEKDRYKG